MWRVTLFSFIACGLLKILSGIAFFEFLSTVFLVIAVLSLIIWIASVIF